MKRLYVFWRYTDFPINFPGVRGAEVADIKDDGKIEPEGYPGFRFVPIKIVPYESGIKINAQIVQLSSEFDLELKKLKKKYTEKLQAILPHKK